MQCADNTTTDRLTWYCVIMTQPPVWTRRSVTNSHPLVTRRGLHHAEGDPQGWQRRLTAAMASEIKRWREIRELSAQQLADRCTSLGYPIPRNVIANIESGRRSAIAVPELLILAIALNVPPILLLYPVGSERLTEIAPDQECEPWFALRWFMADVMPPAELLAGYGEDNTTALREWEAATAALAMYQRHDVLVHRYRFARDEASAELRRMAFSSTPEGEEPTADYKRMADMLAKDMVRAADALRRHRLLMADRGYVLPSLPSDILLDE